MSHPSALPALVRTSVACRKRAFWADAAVLGRLVYRSRAQHRAAPWFKRILQIWRLVKRIQGLAAGPALAQAAHACKAQARPPMGAAPVPGLRPALARLRGTQTLLEALAPVLLAAGADLRRLLASAAFMSLAITLQALLARLWVLAREWVADIQTGLAALEPFVVKDPGGDTDPGGDHELDEVETGKNDEGDMGEDEDEEDDEPRPRLSSPPHLPEAAPQDAISDAFWEARGPPEEEPLREASPLTGIPKVKGPFPCDETQPPAPGHPTSTGASSCENPLSSVLGLPAIAPLDQLPSAALGLPVKGASTEATILSPSPESLSSVLALPSNQGASLLDETPSHASGHPSNLLAPTPGLLVDKRPSLDPGHSTTGPQMPAGPEDKTSLSTLDSTKKSAIDDFFKLLMP